MSQYLLTICIATYNRANFLATTLQGLVEQVNQFNDVGLLVVDGNSTDNTESVVTGFQSLCPHLEYLRLKEKGGVDRDYDIAVRHASGEFCWLFTDDDILKDDAISHVRDLLASGNHDLIIVNAEICDFHMKTVLKARALPIEHPLEMNFAASNRESFFKLCATHITFIGAIVIRKRLWDLASGESFYGSRFIHVGVISTLADSTRVLVASDPLIRIRLGNAEWSNIAFKVWVNLWPDLIWSFPNISDECKKQICLREPWKSPKILFWYRAIGTYSKSHYLEQIRDKPHSLSKLLAALIANMPRVVPWLTFYLYAVLRRDVMKLYCLGDGGKSRNSWLSEN